MSDRQMHGWLDGWMEERMDVQMHRQMDGWMNVQMEGWMNGQIDDGGRDLQTDRWVDEWMGAHG